MIWLSCLKSEKGFFEGDLDVIIIICSRRDRPRRLFGEIIVLLTNLPPQVSRAHPKIPNIHAYSLGLKSRRGYNSAGGKWHISEWKLKKKNRKENLYVLLMFHINVILNCESRLACAVSACCIYCAITMEIMFMKLNNWFIHKNRAKWTEKKFVYEEIKVKKKGKNVFAICFIVLSSKIKENMLWAIKVYLCVKKKF